MSNSISMREKPPVWQHINEEYFNIGMEWLVIIEFIYKKNMRFHVNFALYYI